MYHISVTTSNLKGLINLIWRTNYWFTSNKLVIQIIARHKFLKFIMIKSHLQKDINILDICMPNNIALSYKQVNPQSNQFRLISPFKC